MWVEFQSQFGRGSKSKTFNVIKKNNSSYMVQVKHQSVNEDPVTTSTAPRALTE